MLFNPFSAITSKIFASTTLALLIGFGVQSCRAERLEDKVDVAELQVREARSALAGTVANYRAAALQFAAIAAANVARVKAERDAVFERKVDELQAARSVADARYRRLLASAAEADSRGAGDADLSAVADATCRAYAGTGCNEIPPLLKAAQDNTDQLVALQGAIREQAAIVTSPVPVPDPTAASRD